MWRPAASQPRWRIDTGCASRKSFTAERHGRTASAKRCGPATVVTGRVSETHDVGPEITNSSKKTGRVHDQAASAGRGDPRRSRCVDSGRAPRDMHPAEWHGWTASAKRGDLATSIPGRISGTRKIPACSPLVRARSVLESQAVDVCLEITNYSKKTGRFDEQVASADHGGPLPRKRVGAGRASRDIIPAKRHGRTAPAKRGRSATAVTGRVSGIHDVGLGITNSSKTTGRVHDQAASANRGNPQCSRCADPGCASRDSLPAN